MKTVEYGPRSKINPESETLATDIGGIFLQHAAQEDTLPALQTTIEVFEAFPSRLPNPKTIKNNMKVAWSEVEEIREAVQKQMPMEITDSKTVMYQKSQARLDEEAKQLETTKEAKAQQIISRQEQFSTQISTIAARWTHIGIPLVHAAQIERAIRRKYLFPEELASNTSFQQLQNATQELSRQGIVKPHQLPHVITEIPSEQKVEEKAPIVIPTIKVVPVEKPTLELSPHQERTIAEFIVPQVKEAIENTSDDEATIIAYTILQQFPHLLAKKQWTVHPTDKAEKLFGEIKKAIQKGLVAYTPEDTQQKKRFMRSFQGILEKIRQREDIKNTIQTGNPIPAVLIQQILVEHRIKNWPDYRQIGNGAPHGETITYTSPDQLAFTVAVLRNFRVSQLPPFIRELYNEYFEASKEETSELEK